MSESNSERNLFLEGLEAALSSSDLPKRGRAVAIQKYFVEQGVQLSVQSVHGWLTGRTKPEIDRLPLLAKFLNTTCDFLLGVPNGGAVAHIKSEVSDAARLRVINKIQSNKIDLRALEAIESLIDHFESCNG